VSNFESTKNELMNKLQEVSREKNLDSRDKQGLSDEMNNLKKQVITKDQEIEDQRRSIIELDNRYDSLCH